MSENTTPEKTADGGLSSTDLLALLDSEVDQARDRQKSIIREIEINQARQQVVGEYRVKFMDLRDKLRAKISSANSQDH
jgi:hypothetical protein